MHTKGGGAEGFSQSASQSASRDGLKDKANLVKPHSTPRALGASLLTTEEAQLSSEMSSEILSLDTCCSYSHDTCVNHPGPLSLPWLKG